MLKGLSSFVKNVAKSATTEILRALPESLSPDKKAINSLAGGLALMVVADGKIEDDEMVQALEFLLATDAVKQIGDFETAAVLFEKHVDRLDEAMKAKTPTAFVVAKAQILGEISLISDCGDTYKKALIGMLDTVTSGGGANSGEVAMKDAIVNAIK